MDLQQRVRRAGLAAVAALWAAFAAAPSAADHDTIRIATWNIANLHHAAGESVPGRDVVRSDEDYTWLRHYAYDLKADIVALQEINSRAAAHRLFGRGGWQVFISGRRSKDLDHYDLTGEWGEGSIYTGFAVRKSLNVISVKSVDALEVEHVDPRTGLSRKTRWAMELTVERGGQRLMLLGVHLKSGCFTGALRDAENEFGAFVSDRDADCTTASKQVGPLRRWIEARLDEGMPFVILGDFNRAFDVRGAEDHLWQGLTGGLPGGAQLTRYPNGLKATCWKDAAPAPYHADPIDHMIFSPAAAAMVVPDSFGWLTYDRSLAVRYGRISDHCPAYISLTLPRRPVEGERDGAERNGAEHGAVPASSSSAEAARLIEIDVAGALAKGLRPLGFPAVNPADRADAEKDG